MKDVPENELFSAYLDGELTADEQAQMEQLLSTSPGARRLLDELRTLSTTLQSLPQLKLSEDLGPQVLRVAERRRLREPGPTDVLPAPQPTLAGSVLRSFRNPRTWLWPSIALAVGVMLMMMERGQQQPPARDRQVAVAPKEPKQLKGAKKAGPAPTIQAAAEPALRRAEKELEREVVAKALAAAPMPERPAAEATSLAAAPPAAALAPVTKRDQSGLAAPAEKPEPARALPVEHTKKLAAAPVVAKESGQREAQQPPAPPATVAPAASAPMSGLAEKKPGAGPMLAKASAEHQGKGGGFGGRGAGAGPMNAAQSVNGLARAGRARQERAQPAEDLLVVYCDISPEAARQRAFGSLLAANGIVWESPEMAKNRDKDSGGPAAGTRLAAAGTAAGVEMVYVEATPEQIEATLAAIRAKPDAFLAVSQEPAVGGPVQHHRRAVSAGQGDEMKARKATAPTLQKDEQQMVSQEESAAQPSRPSGAASQSRGVVGGSFTLRQSVAKQAAVAEQAKADREEKAAAPRPADAKQGQQVVLRSRALFVLRVVRPDAPTAASTAGAADEVKAAKAARPAAAAAGPAEASKAAAEPAKQ